MVRIMRIVAQRDGVDPGKVRLQVNENRKLSSGEVVELAETYEVTRPS